MPLSDPGVERRQYHTRRVEVQGFFRADGLWDIEGHICDTKTYDFENRQRGLIAAGVPVHDMWLRLTIDDDLLIHGAEASPEAGPYTSCGAIAPDYQKLIGLRVGPGFHRGVKARLGGVAGCTHITELLYPMATICFQTAYGSRNRARQDFGLSEGQTKERPNQSTDQRSGQRSGQRPGHLDTCHALRIDGPVVKQFWPQFYTGE